MINIELEFNTGGRAYPGVDHSALIGNIDAEVVKLAKQVSAKPERTNLPAPDGSYSEIDGVKWVVDLATDPKAAVLYAKIFLFAVNQILIAIERRKRETSDEENNVTEQRDSLPAKVRLLGEELALPTTTLVILGFLEVIGED